MREFKISSFDGCQLAVRAEGPEDRPPVLLSHSLGATLDIWDDAVAGWADQFRIIRYDSRGHGESDAPPGVYTVEMLARDAFAVLDSQQISKADFVGLSQGAMSGMWLATHAPERINRLVLANTTAFIAAKDRLNALIETAGRSGMDSIAAPTILGWLSAGFKARHPEKVQILVDTMRRMSPVGYIGACTALRDVDLRTDLARIAARTLVINGLEEGERGAGAAAHLTSGIPGARRVDLPDTAHLSPVESPRLFCQAVRDFLA